MTNLGSVLKSRDITLLTKVHVVRSVGASLVTQMVKNPPAKQETWVQSLVMGRSPVEGNANPLQYSCLENSVDRGAYLSYLIEVV